MCLHRVVALLLPLALSAPAGAQIGGDRAHTWEAGFHVVDMSSVFVSHSFGASLDVDSTVGYGFTGAYNFTNRFALMLDYNWAQPRYLATFVPDGPGPVQTVSTDLGVSTIQGKAVYYFLDGSLTPFVELGFGWTTVDSNIADGPPITGCWWDFFWGYVCRSYYDTYTETNTSYSYGVGVRWDFSPEFMLRGSIGALEIDIDSGKNPSLDLVQFDFAWRY